MDFNQVKEILSEKKKVVIFTHKNPDGDAIGSSLALSRYLSNKHEVTIIYPDKFPNNFKWVFEETDSILCFDEKSEEATTVIEESEFIFCLDFNHLNRVGDKLEKVIAQQKKPKALIDHHPQPSDFADFIVSDTASSSTCELVYSFLENLKGDSLFGLKIIEPIYIGISTDTGNFTYNSSNPNTFLIIADMLKQGFDKDKINKQLYGNNRSQRLKLLGFCLNRKLRILKKQRTAYITLTNKEKERFNFEKGDSEGFVNMILDIKGIEFAAFIAENEENIRMSFRSKYHFDTNKFARNYFNGGGHLHASGGTSYMDMEKTVMKFEEAVEKEKERIFGIRS
jgi:phosphoesterase RecJ-like protein